MKKDFLLKLLLVLIFFCVNGCSFLGKSSDGPRPKTPTVTKQEAIRLAKDFATQQGLGDEFLINKPSNMDKQLTLGENPHWVWQVYFAHKSQTLMKFYKNSLLMVEINAETGSVEHWGRR